MGTPRFTFLRSIILSIHRSHSVPIALTYSKDFSSNQLRMFVRQKVRRTIRLPVGTIVRTLINGRAATRKQPWSLRFRLLCASGVAGTAVWGYVAFERRVNIAEMTYAQVAANDFPAFSTLESNSDRTSSVESREERYMQRGGTQASSSRHVRGGTNSTIGVTSLASLLLDSVRMQCKPLDSSSSVSMHSSDFTWPLCVFFSGSPGRDLLV
jgi:hypothetical protein